MNRGRVKRAKACLKCTFETALKAEKRIIIPLTEFVSMIIDAEWDENYNRIERVY
jgi:hypothetical protein